MTAQYMRSYINLLENALSPEAITNNLARQISNKIGDALEGTAHQYARQFYTQNQKANKSPFFKDPMAGTNDNNIFYHIIDNRNKMTNGLFRQTAEFQVCVIDANSEREVHNLYKQFVAPFKNTNPESYVTQPHFEDYGNTINGKPVRYLVWSITLPWPNIESAMELADKLGLQVN